MSWFYLALIPPALYATVNHTDKYLVRRYFPNAGAGSLLIFSSLIGAALFPFILIVKPDVLEVAPLHAILMIGNGILYIVALLPYLWAIQREETSVATPLFQTIPVFGYMLGYVFLGETLTRSEFAGSILILIGAFILSLELDALNYETQSRRFWNNFGYGLREKSREILSYIARFFSRRLAQNSSQNRLREFRNSEHDGARLIKRDILGLMLLSSFLIAVIGVSFKFIAIQESFWAATFWQYVGLALTACFTLAAIPSARREFFGAIRANGSSFVTLNVAGELVNVAAMLVSTYATLLAPVALVWTVNGFQPMFTLAIGIFLTLFIPRWGKERIGPRDLVQKALAVALMLAGAYFINA